MEAALEGLYLRTKPLWEATRCLLHIIAQVNNLEKLDAKDLMTFPWEENQSIQEADDRYEALQKEMSNYLKEWNKHARGFSDPAMAGK